MSKRVLHHFPRLHAAYRAYRDSRHPQQEARRTPQGFWLAGNTAMQLGAFEPVETAIVTSLLEEVDVLINVGANIGYYCCLGLAAGKQVVAFEPMPTNLQFLLSNMLLNGWEDTVEIFPLALGARTGVVKMYGGGTGASLVPGWANQTEERYTLVPLSTLDLILGERFGDQRCLVLVDVEGAELPMLRGAQQLLRRHPKPIWMLEVSINEHQPQGTTINPQLLETFQLLCDAGYHATTASEVQREVHLDEVQRIAATGNDTLRTHNFIFR